MSGNPADPLSLLFVIPYLPPMGGAEVHAVRLARALRERGHSVRILTISDDESGPPPPVRPVATSRMRAAFYVRIAWAILSRRYAVVHFFLAGRHTAIGMVTSWLAGCRRVAMYGGSEAFAIQQARWLGRLALVADVKLAHRLIALNEEMRASFRACGAPDERIVMLPCEVDPDFFSPADPADAAPIRARFGVPPGAQLVAFVGRLVAQKAIPTLVAAFGRLAQADPAAFLVLAGDGPERPRLEEQIRHLPEPGRVVLAGRLDETEVRDLLRAADVFALVSSTEGIPCALVEAMAVGLPCVVSDIAGMREFVASGVNGLQVPQGDEEALADALLALLRDRPRRLQMGREARRIALERYTPAIVAEAHEKLYREILAEAPR